MPTWLVNGQPVDAVRPDDRGLAYGDGLFETIAFRNGSPRFLDRHMARLIRGCARLRIEPPVPQVIAEEIQRLTTGEVRGTVKVIVTRGAGPRGYSWQSGITPTRAVIFHADDAGPQDRHREGVAVVMCRTPASCNTVLAGIKTLNRLDNVMARAELRGLDVPEGLMFDSRGRLVGGTMCNIFIARQRQLLTPALTESGIRGVMRDVVIETARASGIAVRETEVGRDDLMSAEEVFLTNSLIGIWPVVRCADLTFGIGAMTREVATALGHRGVEECVT